MNAETRLADIVAALQGSGLNCLVMGGHAVRYYGLMRNTIDYDLHLAPEAWADLPARLAGTFLGAGLIVEGVSWRPQSFRRFQIGRLPDGHEEWLEFWCGNHLLAPFPELYARKEEGSYGGRTLPFLSLPDLIRSKETTRATDWADVAVLEEFLDNRLLALASRKALALHKALGGLRSRSGFERALLDGLLADVDLVAQALAEAHLGITQALLLPFSPSTVNLPATTPTVEPLILSRLRTVVPSSSLHLALVEAVRRQYRLAAQAADQADKEAIRAAQVHK